MTVPALLEVKPFARESGLAVRRVRQLLADGRLSHIKCGKKYLIPASEIAAFIERELQPRLAEAEGDEAHID